jgi:decaprenyl-phosphate phosphoribosyltransferase
VVDIGPLARPDDVERPGPKESDPSRIRSTPDVLRPVDGRIGAGSPTRRVVALVHAMRPRQWIKNVLVFVAPAAAGVLGHRADALRTLATFGIFCLASSGTYLVNDAIDVEADRHHPIKRRRPIASGSLSVPFAVVLGSVLMLGATALAWALAGADLAIVLGVYAVISVAYTVRLKREPVVELAAVASGFLLRGIAGGVAVHVPLSSWFLVVTSFGALFIVTGKRTAEYKQLGDGRAAHRPVLDKYTQSFLQSTLIMMASVTVTAYCLWAFDRTGLHARSDYHFVWIELTVAPVIIGVLHVLRLLDAGKGGAPEELLLRDRFVQLLGIVWIALFSVGLYG